MSGSGLSFLGVSNKLTTRAAIGVIDPNLFEATKEFLKNSKGQSGQPKDRSSNQLVFA